MDPIEINAGAWYLRALDAQGWSSDTRYSWAVCEAATGEPVADVTLDPATGAIDTQARDGHDDAASTAAEAVRRFAMTLPSKPLTRDSENRSQVVVDPRRPE